MKENSQSVSEEARKRQRRAEKNSRLQRQINGNSGYRRQLIDEIIQSYYTVSTDLSPYKETLTMLLKQKENYKGCEKSYDRLFILLGLTPFKEMAEKFQKKLAAKK